MNDTEKNINSFAIAVYGETAQENQCIEECAELIQAINKKHRKMAHNIAEEIADVEICLEQLKMINGCYEDVCRIKKLKLNRLCGRIIEEMRGKK